MLCECASVCENGGGEGKVVLWGNAKKKVVTKGWGRKVLW
jgi:hypothetical protein